MATASGYALEIVFTGTGFRSITLGRSLRRLVAQAATACSALRQEYGSLRSFERNDLVGSRHEPGARESMRIRPVFHASRPGEDLRPDEILHSRDFRLRPHYGFFDPPARPLAACSQRHVTYRIVERAFEAVRQVTNPDAPQRMVAIYAFPCLACASWFRDRSRRGGAVWALHPQAGSRFFAGDLLWRNLATNVILKDAWLRPSFPFVVGSSVEALERAAETYWRGIARSPSRSRPELLIDGSALVGRRIAESALFHARRCAHV